MLVTASEPQINLKVPGNRGAKRVLIVLVVVFALAAAATLVFADRSNEITGQIDVIDTEEDPVGFGSCTGADISAGYDDLAPGAGVTVKDESGDIIATGVITEGEWTRFSCALRFTVADVPKAEFYQVEISHRGEQRLSHEDLVEQNFHLELSIGS